MRASPRYPFRPRALLVVAVVIVALVVVNYLVIAYDVNGRLDQVDGEAIGRCLVQHLIGRPC